MKRFYNKIVSVPSCPKNRYCLMVALFLLSITVRAGTYNVTSTTDGSASNQLRGAIAAAETAGGSNIINIAAGTYTLNSMIAFANKGSQTFTFVGAGDGITIISMTTGSGKDRIFNINYNILPAVNISFTGVAFTNANLTTSDGAGGGAIDCGGPTNTMTIKNCVFTNNKVTTASMGGQIGGGAIQCYGGTLTIDSCTFSGNSSSQLLGGAIHYTLINSTNASGAIVITKSVFNTNAVSGSVNAKGGAIFVSPNAQTVNPASYTFSTSITGCTFTGNTSSGFGGAIAVDNNFASGNGAPININYNRFVGNTAFTNTTSAFAMGATIGNVDASSNWWGCNAGPTGCADKGALIGTGPTFTSTPYLQLTVTSSASPLCAGGTSTITGSFLLNSASAAVSPSNLTAMVGLPVSYSQTLGSLSNQQTTIQASGTATATYTAGSTAGTGGVTVGVDNASVATSGITVNAGTSVNTLTATTNVCAGSSTNIVASASGTSLTYQWRKNTTNLGNGPTGTGATISGVTTNTLSIANAQPGDAASNYNVVVSGTCGSPITSTNAALVVNVGATVGTQPPTITTACTGTTATISATAAGTPTPTYQWRIGSTNVTNGTNGAGSVITGATSATLSIASLHASDAATTYNVVVTNACSSSPTNTSNNVTLAVNVPPSISTSPTTNVSGCMGNTITFTASATGTPTPTVQWNKGGSPLANGPTGSGSTIANSTTNTLTITNAQIGDNGSYTFFATNTCNNATSSASALTISTTSIAAIGTSGSSTISSTNTVINSSGCIPIANVVPFGASPVAGSVTATSTYDATPQKAPGGNYYVQRHYDIVPATNAANATANVTLYYLQSDFTNYNATSNHGPNLPVDATDALGNKANVRVSQYHGTATTSPSKAGFYSGTGIDINPGSSNVVWNSTLNRWEVTIPVAGFSGFYLGNTNTPLPLTLLSFVGTAQNGNAFLQWSTSNEVNTNYFEILKSTNGIDFTNITQLPTTGNGSSGTNNYQYNDVMGYYPAYYYQLKMVDKDGQSTNSNIVSVNNLVVGNGYIVKVTPNPFKSKVIISLNAPADAQLTVELMDMSGKKLFTQHKIVSQGDNTIPIDQFNNLAHGTYLLHIFNNTVNQTIKLVKVE